MAWGVWLVCITRRQYLPSSFASYSLSLLSKSQISITPKVSYIESRW
jgi:hypothetical protein